MLNGETCRVCFGDVRSGREAIRRFLEEISVSKSRCGIDRARLTVRCSLKPDVP